jgi:hypothetical protein
LTSRSPLEHVRAHSTVDLEHVEGGYTVDVFLGSG